MLICGLRKDQFSAVEKKIAHVKYWEVPWTYGVIQVSFRKKTGVGGRKKLCLKESLHKMKRFSWQSQGTTSYCSALVEGIEVLLCQVTVIKY